MNKPLVSVITPTYNRESTIERSIRSVLNQTYENFEYLIVDDGSTDNTLDVISKFNDSRIRIIQLEKNSGQSAAMNAGIDSARGSFITFLDSDDEFTDDRLKEQVQKFIELPPSVGIVTCGRLDVDHNGRVYHQWVPVLKGNLLNNIIKTEKIGAGPPFLMIRKEVFDKGLRFDTALRSAKELDFIIKCFICGYTLDYVNKPLLKVYHEQFERTFNHTQATITRLLMIKRYPEIFKENTYTKNYLYKTLLWSVLSGKKYLVAKTIYHLRQINRKDYRAWLLVPHFPIQKIRNGYIKVLKYFYKIH